MTITDHCNTLQSIKTKVTLVRASGRNGFHWSFYDSWQDIMTLCYFLLPHNDTLLTSCHSMSSPAALPSKCVRLWSHACFDIYEFQCAAKCDVFCHIVVHHDGRFLHSWERKASLPSIFPSRCFVVTVGPERHPGLSSGSL